MARDPWDVLGVAKTAIDDEIKRVPTYAWQHTDKQGGDEAYPRSKRRYPDQDATARQRYLEEQMGSRNFRDMGSSFDPYTHLAVCMLIK